MCRDRWQPPSAPPELPDDWEARDAHDSYFEAVRAIGEQVRAGDRELPAMFRSSREREELGDETVPVTCTVLRIDPVPAGRLLALAAVELLVDGIMIELRGVRVVRTGPRTLGVEPPTYRGPTGAAVPAVILPPELSAAIASAVLDEYQAGRCRPAELYV